MFESLSQIASVKSVMREETESFFRQIVAELDTTELYLNGEVIKISDIAVEPQVITNERVIENPKMFAADGDTSGFESKGDVAADMVADNYERVSQPEKYKQISWKQALAKKNLRLAVKGEPGGGKSFITKYTAIEIALESLKKLDSFTTVLEDIEFSIWLTANELAEFRSRDTVEQSLIELAKSKNPKLSPKFWARFSKQINRAGVEALPKFFVFVDGLDELFDENFKSFSVASQKLYNFPARIVAACREFQWKGMQSLLKWNKFTEVTLAPFGNPEQKRVIDNFFSRQPELKNSLRKLAESNYALRSTFSSPLLLTFACLLHQTGDLDENTMHINLYEMMVANLFNGTYCPADRKPKWMRREANDRYNPNDRITMLKALFDEIGWQLFQKHPTAKEFELKDWNAASERAIKVVKQSYPQISKIADSSEFRNELMNIRLILMTNNQRGKEKWYYLHRTLLEFTSARALAGRGDWLKEAKKHFWDSVWLEQLTFLAGLLEVEDVKQLISAVRTEEDDIFGSMTFLEAKFTGVSKLSETTDIADICHRIICAFSYIEKVHRVFMIDATAHQRLQGSHLYHEFIHPARLALELNAPCRRYFHEHLISSVLSKLINKSNNDELRQTAAEALFKLGVESAEVIAALQVVLLDKSNGESLRKAAAEALIELGIGSAELITALREILLDQSNTVWLRRVAIGAFVNSGVENEEVIAVLLAVLLDQSNAFLVRNPIVYKLVELGIRNPEVIGALQVVSLEESNGERLRQTAAKALINLRVGNAKEIVVLRKVLLDEFNDKNSLYDVVRELGELGIENTEVIALLREAFLDQSKTVGLRIAAAKALINLEGENEEAIAMLREVLLDKSNYHGLRHAAKALINLGGESAEAIVELRATLINKYQYIDLILSTPEVLDKLGVERTEVIAVLREFLLDRANKDDWFYNYDFSVELVRSYLKMKPVEVQVRELLTYIIKKLYFVDYVLNPYLATPLYDIQRFLRQSQPDFKITHEFLSSN